MLSRKDFLTLLLPPLEEGESYCTVGIKDDGDDEGFDALTVRKGECPGSREIIQAGNRRAVAREIVHRDQTCRSVRSHDGQRHIGCRLVHTIGRQIGRAHV